MSTVRSPITCTYESFNLQDFVFFLVFLGLGGGSVHRVRVGDMYLTCMGSLKNLSEFPTCQQDRWTMATTTFSRLKYNILSQPGLLRSNVSAGWAQKRYILFIKNHNQNETIILLRTVDYRT